MLDTQSSNAYGYLCGHAFRFQSILRPSFQPQRLTPLFHQSAVFSFNSTDRCSAKFNLGLHARRARPFSTDPSTRHHSLGTKLATACGCRRRMFNHTHFGIVVLHAVGCVHWIHLRHGPTVLSLLRARAKRMDNSPKSSVNVNVNPIRVSFDRSPQR